MASQRDVPMFFAGRAIVLADILDELGFFVPQRYIQKPDANAHLNPCEIQGKLCARRATIGITDFDKDKNKRQLSGPWHAYVKASPGILEVVAAALRRAVAVYDADRARQLDPGGTLAKVMVQQLPPPPPKLLPLSLPPPPPEWRRFADPVSHAAWWARGEEWFWEDAERWDRYCCPGTGRVWRCCERLGISSYE